MGSWIPESELADSFGPGSLVEMSMRALSAGKADAVIAGCVHTSSEVLRGILTEVGVAKTRSRITGGAWLQIRTGDSADQPRDLLVVDPIVAPSLNVETMTEATIGAVDLYWKCRQRAPRVALVSSSTLGSGMDPHSQVIGSVMESLLARRPDLCVEGPVQLDAALRPEVARKKGSRRLDGRADILVMPDLAVANISYKLAQYCGARVATFLTGTRLPVADLSRGADVAEIVATSLLATVDATRSSTEVGTQRDD